MIIDAFVPEAKGDNFLLGLIRVNNPKGVVRVWDFIGIITSSLRLVRSRSEV